MKKNYLFLIERKEEEEKKKLGSELDFLGAHLETSSVNQNVTQ